MKKVKARARYHRMNDNPFRMSYPRGSSGHADAEVDASLSKSEVERFAAQATPEGYVLVNVFLVQEDGKEAPWPNE